MVLKYLLTLFLIVGYLPSWGKELQQLKKEAIKYKRAYKKTKKKKYLKQYKKRVKQIKAKQAEEVQDESPQQQTKKSKPKNKYLAFVGMYTWKEYYTLTSQTEKLRFSSSVNAPCLGMGYQWQRVKTYWELSGCLFTTTVDGATVNNPGNNQLNVPLQGLLIFPGYHWRVFTEQATLGVELPLLYSQGDYDTAPGYTLENDSKTILGTQLISRYQFSSHFSLATRVGKFWGLESLNWGFSLEYQF